MAETFRILVTGSRTWANRGRLCHELVAARGDLAPFASVVVVHGACPSGADRFAADEAAGLGWQVEPHPADWQRHGKRAGFIRNAEMVALGADLCLAFLDRCTQVACDGKPAHGSHGGTDCADRAERAGIPTRRYTSYEV